MELLNVYREGNFSAVYRCVLWDVFVGSKVSQSFQVNGTVEETRSTVKLLTPACWSKEIGQSFEVFDKNGLPYVPPNLLIIQS